jgi:hypothetical protein
LNFAVLIENDLFKFGAASLATKLKNRHDQAPFLHYTKKKEEGATALSPTISFERVFASSIFLGRTTPF